MPAPHLIPVVEVGRRSTTPFWCPLPPDPWPRWVKLWGKSTDDEIALTLYELSLPIGPGEPATPSQLVERGPRAGLSGGLAAFDGQRSAYPGCCCWLNGWRDWEKGLTSGRHPWLGHDPDPWIERRGRRIYIWPDVMWPADDAARAAHAVRATRKKLADALGLVEQHLVDFQVRLEQFVLLHQPALAGDIGRLFADAVC